MVLTKEKKKACDVMILVSAIVAAESFSHERGRKKGKRREKGWGRDRK